MTRIRDFLRDRRGNYAMMTAVLAVPMLMAMGYSVDFVRVLDAKQRLEHAADSAVLGSLAMGSKAIAYADTMTGPGPIPVGVAEAEDFFTANARLDPSISLGTVIADVTNSGTKIVSKIKYTAQIQTIFGGLLSKKAWTVNGSASASVDIDNPIDFYLLLDNSPSMGLAATAKAIDQMIALTPDRCAFACHALNNADNYYNLAKANGIPLRIDMVREATKKVLETAKSIRAYNSQYRVAIYTFGAAATNLGLTTISGLTSDLVKAGKAAEAVDLMTIPYQNYDNDQQTDFDKTIGQLRTSIPKPENGPNGKPRQQIVFFVSDGVNDSYKPSGCMKKIQGSGRCQQPLDIKECDELKKKDIKIAVLYTTYLPVTNNSWYNTWIKPFRDEIPTQMQACASPGLYFEVSPSQGIPEAMDALFRKAVRVLRLES
ncbi:MAG TPA: hypothetical protein GX405_01180 [Rhizobiales bacterium]|nr:hypothetical protein [Hyphomicrobiales bacterium]